MTLDELRRKASVLKRAYAAGDSAAADRVRTHLRPGADPLKHADFLNVIACEAGFASWPQMKLAVETDGMDRAARRQRFRIALEAGQDFVIRRLLADMPDLARGAPDLEIATYDLAAVRAALDADPGTATRAIGPRRPILHLAFSGYHRIRPDLRDGMLGIAELLVAAGADVNDAAMQDDEPLSALYGAMGHAGNMMLAEWLLDRGADPNDGESLYHATELGHQDGLRMLLAHGATPGGTNALPRALDFNDHRAVRMLLDAGADPNEGLDGAAGQIPALHQAARRLCDRAMVDLLLDAGADPSTPWRGASPYALARIFGNDAAAAAIAGAGGDTALSGTETLLARAADGTDSPGRFIDPATLGPETRNLIAALIALPASSDHIRRLVALGLEYDRPGGMGVPPVQQAGWAGRADLLGYLLGLGPDLTHRNDHGGTLLDTIIHGSENAPRGAGTDHIACARLALDHGLFLPRRTVELAGDPDMRAFLSDRAETHPGQVVEGGAP